MARVWSRRAMACRRAPDAPNEGGRRGPGSAGGGLFGFLGRLLRATGDLAPEPGDGVVAGVDHALFHGDDAVVGDLDVLGAHLSAALGDVAHAEAAVVRELAPIVDVEGVHLELGEADEEAGPGVFRLVLLVVTDHVADVLAHEALDALAELLAALDVDLQHAVAALGL